MNKVQKNGFFTAKLLEWNESLNLRVMPWKGEKNPYKIWLSEIILQQTRVEQGLVYYNRFIKKFPTIHSLAQAEDEVVFKLWEGLGYYSRCKNILLTARVISRELNGIFPATYNEILNLKGIGPYTAAAIASFAYELPYAVVDGNVLRLLSRFFGITTPIDSTTGKKDMAILAASLLYREQPAQYNQAIMDLGATVCKPQQPLCSACPLQNACFAFSKNMIKNLPVKQQVMRKRDRWFYYFIVEKEGKLFIKKRVQKDIWQNLHEFVLIEKKKNYSPHQVIKSDGLALLSNEIHEVIKISDLCKQQLTHQTINGYFIHVKLKNNSTIRDYKPVDRESLSKLAFPKFITDYCTQSDVFYSNGA